MKQEGTVPSGAHSRSSCPMRGHEHGVHTELARSLQIGHHRFPTRADYATYFAEQRCDHSIDKVWSDEAAVVAIQNDWLRRGQSGCLFARHILRNAPGSGWRALAFYPEDTGWDACCKRLDQVIEETIASPDGELLSLLFPFADTLDGLMQVIRAVDSLDRTRLFPVGAHKARVGVGVRVHLDSGVESWVLGFGPYHFFPPTRQAPVTELIVRTKARARVPRVATDSSRVSAHVADAPLDIDSNQFNRLWHASIRRTQAMLGPDDRALSRARITFALPLATIANLQLGTRTSSLQSETPAIDCADTPMQCR